MTPPTPFCLTIAGSDPCGGAGIQADLKVFQAHNCFGCSVTTLETIQNPEEVLDVYINKPEIVLKQLKALNYNFAAIKIGALGNKEIIKAILESKILEDTKVIIDPIISSSNDFELFKKADLDFLKSELLPQAFLLTPNIPEAELLTGAKINSIEGMKKAAKKIKAKNVLIKGGHLDGNKCVDILYTNNSFIELSNEKIKGKNPHGTGCFLSSNITSLIARGKTIESAIKDSINITNSSIQKSKNRLLNFLI